MSAETGGLSHIGLRCADIERTERFYTQVLGGSVIQRRDQPDRRIWFSVRGVRLEIAQAEMPPFSEAQRRVLPTVSFLVDAADVDSIVERLRAGGVRFREPMLKATGSGVGVYFADPDGNPLSLSCPAGYARDGLQRAVQNDWVPGPYAWSPEPTATHSPA